MILKKCNYCEAMTDSNGTFCSECGMNLNRTDFFGCDFEKAREVALAICEDSMAEGGCEQCPHDFICSTFKHKLPDMDAQEFENFIILEGHDESSVWMSKEAGAKHE